MSDITAIVTDDDVDAAIERAEASVAAGEGPQAIEALTSRNRIGSDARIEEALVRMRHRAALQVLDDLDPVEMEPVTAAPVRSLTEIPADQLSVEVLRDGLAHQGCVLVRGLISESRAAAWRDRIDRTLAAFDEGLGGRPARETTPWYRPFRPDGDHYRVGGRKWMRESGGIWSVDAPHPMFELCDLIEETGIARLVADYFGERPLLSANKCNLRRVPTTTSSNWHQDGAFLGRDVRSLNLWLALGSCGIDAPGLDIVPRRFDHIVETGTEGAWFDWAVAPDVVEDAAGDVEILRPEFSAGDALLFDHLFLHRTGVSESMTQERHAIESWFFAPSGYPDGQIPILY